MSMEGTGDPNPRRDLLAERGPEELAQDFVQFYQSGKPRVFYHALALVGDRTIAEDLTQDAFLRLFAEIRYGNPIRSAVKWTNRVLRNLALNYLERSHVASRIVFDDLEVYREIIPTHAPTAEQELLSKERQDMLGRVVRGLPAVERTCLLLFAEGFSFQQIADRQRLSYDVTVAHVRRGLRKVRKQLAAYGH